MKESNDKQTWGAYKSDWSKFIELGLVADLLPVVSNPGAGISKNSTMKFLCKTPSLYNKDGEAVGIANWTQKESVMNDIAIWSREEDLGICIQTRHVRGLDIDLPDKKTADRMSDFITEFFTTRNIPIPPLRFRGNSGKRLLAFKVEGQLGKRIVKVDGGIVEFLANGQQFIAAGTHPSGARYEWYWGKHTEFPTIDKEVFEDLWFALCQEFAIASPTQKGVRSLKDSTAIEDTTSKWLEAEGYSLGNGPEGEVYIECPFNGEHTTESSISATAYFPAGSNGYERGHFICLHAHCSHRQNEEYLDHYGLRQKEFTVVEISEEEKALEPPTYQRDQFGRPKALLHNLKLALSREDICGSVPCYDTFRDEIIFYTKDRKKWRRASDAYYTTLRMRLETLHKFLPISREMIRDVVLMVAEQNTVDTAQEWLDGLVWDGVPRIERFLTGYFGTADTEYTAAVSTYFWTGLAGRVIVPGLKADMVPIAKGAQGLMKSTAISAIAPSMDEFCEIDFEAKEDDLSRKMRGILIAEISELRGMKTRAIETIKAFTSRTHEKWIPKYREFAISFPRRLMFMATTNDDAFLADATGNRRWLPFEVERFVDVDKIRKDRNQLWAEARETFNMVGLCFEKAERLATQHHELYTMRDAWADIIEDWLYRAEDLDNALRPVDRPSLRTVDIFREALNMDARTIKKIDEMKIADTLRSIGYKNVRDYVDGRRGRVWVKS